MLDNKLMTNGSESVSSIVEAFPRNETLSLVLDTHIPGDTTAIEHLGTWLRASLDKSTGPVALILEGQGISNTDMQAFNNLIGADVSYEDATTLLVTRNLHSKKLHLDDIDQLHTQAEYLRSKLDPKTQSSRAVQVAKSLDDISDDYPGRLLVQYENAPQELIDEQNRLLESYTREKMLAYKQLIHGDIEAATDHFMESVVAFSKVNDLREKRITEMVDNAYSYGVGGVVVSFGSNHAHLPSRLGLEVPPLEEADVPITALVVNKLMSGEDVAREEYTHALLYGALSNQIKMLGHYDSTPESRHAIHTQVDAITKTTPIATLTESIKRDGWAVASKSILDAHNDTSKPSGEGSRERNPFNKALDEMSSGNYATYDRLVGKLPADDSALKTLRDAARANGIKDTDSWSVDRRNEQRAQAQAAEKVFLEQQAYREKHPVLSAIKDKGYQVLAPLVETAKLLANPEELNRVMTQRQREKEQAIRDIAMQIRESRAQKRVEEDLVWSTPGVSAKKVGVGIKKGVQAVQMGAKLASAISQTPTVQNVLWGDTTSNSSSRSWEQDGDPFHNLLAGGTPEQVSKGETEYDTWRKFSSEREAHELRENELRSQQRSHDDKVTADTEASGDVFSNWIMRNGLSPKEYEESQREVIPDVADNQLKGNITKNVLGYPASDYDPLADFLFGSAHSSADLPSAPDQPVTNSGTSAFNEWFWGDSATVSPVPNEKSPDSHLPPTVTDSKGASPGKSTSSLKQDVVSSKAAEVSTPEVSIDKQNFVSKLFGQKLSPQESITNTPSLLTPTTPDYSWGSYEQPHVTSSADDMPFVGPKLQEFTQDGRPSLPTLKDYGPQNQPVALQLKHEAPAMGKIDDIARMAYSNFEVFADSLESKGINPFETRAYGGIKGIDRVVREGGSLTASERHGVYDIASASKSIASSEAPLPKGK